MSLKMFDSQLFSYLNLGRMRILAISDLSLNRTITSNKAARKIKPRQIGETILEVKMVTDEYKEVWKVYRVKI